MTPDQTTALYIIAGLLAFGALWRREAIEYAVRQVAVAFICAVVVFALLAKGGLSPQAAYIGALVVGVLIGRAQPRRSRYLSTRTKRQAIAKRERETGETFNRRIHELHHVLAHSRRGGSRRKHLSSD